MWVLVQVLHDHDGIDVLYILNNRQVYMQEPQSYMFTAACLCDNVCAQYTLTVALLSPLPRMRLVNGAHTRVSKEKSVPILLYVIIHVHTCTGQTPTNLPTLCFLKYQNAFGEFVY